MPQLLITRGLPASGKSTWARNWVSEGENRVEINRDNCRKMLGFPPLGNKDQEAMVTSALDSVLERALATGCDIVVSNMNLRARYVKEIVAQGLGAEQDYDIQVVDFTPDLDTLISRDAAREDSVGEQVIRDLYRKFPYKSWVSGEELIRQAQDKMSATRFNPIHNDDSLPAAVVFDMDGTLALMNGRSPYDFAKVGQDTLNQPVYQALLAHKAQGARIIIFSGREDVCLDQTVSWLKDNQVPYDQIHMRAAGDKRRDDLVKYEMVVNNLVGNYHVAAWYDDRDQVVSMVRQAVGQNLCFQVNYGAF